MSFGQLPLPVAVEQQADIDPLLQAIFDKDAECPYRGQYTSACSSNSPGPNWK
jgi:hypothetical protein